MTAAGQPGRLAGKVALVTGASSGIGAATALALAGEGAKVAVAARRRDRLQDLAARIKAGGGEALVLEVDVTDEAAVRRMVSDTRQQLGRLDVLVNNAGVMLLGAVVGADTTEWRRMVELNVMALLNATHAALPVMLEQATPDDVCDIVNVSSVAGRVARAGSGVYNATKWAVNAFSEALRQEVTERGIRVTLVEPGAVATELASHVTDEQAKAAMAKRFGQIRMLDADDIARAIVYVVTQPAHVAVNEVLVRPTGQTG